MIQACEYCETLWWQAQETFLSSLDQAIPQGYHRRKQTLPSHPRAERKHERTPADPLSQQQNVITRLHLEESRYGAMFSEEEIPKSATGWVVLSNCPQTLFNLHFCRQRTSLCDTES